MEEKIFVLEKILLESDLDRGLILEIVKELEKEISEKLKIVEKLEQFLAEVMIENQSLMVSKEEGEILKQEITVFNFQFSFD